MDDKQILAQKKEKELEQFIMWLVLKASLNVTVSSEIM